MGKVLELSFGSVQETIINTSTVATSEIDLDLLPNQIAEIHHIDSVAVLGDVATDHNYRIDGALSMNPDENDDPSTQDAQERLEFFYMHRYHFKEEFTTSGNWGNSLNENKQLQLSAKPYLVGTNIGLVASLENDDDVGQVMSWWVRVYFTRRKATAQELNQILLKRR